MGRSIPQVTQSLKDSFTEINPSLDLLVGPTYDYTMRPVPQEIAFVESQVSRLLVYYSPDFPIVATPSESRDLATNFGISVSQGERARGLVTFFRTTPPPAGSTLTIPLGQLVGTRDFQFLFQATESKTMLGDFANTYYNPQTGRYEISVLVQAVLPGQIYNLPSNRISQIVSGSTVPGQFNGVVQLQPMSGGTEPETTSNLASRVIQQFKGINLNSVTGLSTLASRYVPTGIIDSHVIRPTDRLEFRRPTSGPAIDLCIKGVDIQDFTEEYFALGGELNIPLSTSTAVSVTQVQVNSTILDTTLWVFVLDTSPAYQGSTRAVPSIEFVNPLTANDIVNFTGTQNFLLDSVQAIVTPSDDAIFKTDVLVRSFVDLPISVGVELKVLNSALTNLNDVQSSLDAGVVAYIESDTIPDLLTAEGLTDFLRGIIPNVENLLVYEFRRTLTSISNLETIQPLKNQAPVFDTASSSLVVRS